MTTPGLTPAGLVTQTQDEIFDDMVEQAVASPDLGANINFEAESPDGQAFRVYSAGNRELQEALEDLNNAWNPLAASDVALDNLVRLKGVSARLKATSSRLTLTLQGTPLTPVPAGSAVVLEGSNSRWTIEAAATIGAGGTVDAVFIADSTGPIQALTGSTWTIATPVTGWAGATNAADAERGRDLETNGELRARFLRATNARGGSAPDSLLASIRAVVDVTEAVIIDNNTRWPDAEGRPPHSFEAVVRGGDEQAVANTIWRGGKSMGSGMVTTVAAANQVELTVLDVSGNPQTVRFSRPDLIPVWVEIDYKPSPSAPVDIETRIQQSLLDFDASVQVGDEVTPTRVRQAILCYAGLGGAFISLTLRIGLSASPPIAQAVPASLTQLPDFDSARILITRV